MRLLSIATCLVSLSFASAQTSIATVIGSTPNGQLGTVVRAVGDIDGDGVPDFAISEPAWGYLPGHCYIVSGATRAVLRTFQGQGSGNTGLGAVDICPVGDVDGDGHPDFAIGYMSTRALDVFSGATGARLYEDGPVIEYQPIACGAGDLDGDGRDDFVAMVRVNSLLQIWTIRGVTGTQLSTMSTNPQGAQFLRNLGDVDGDGFPEVADCGYSTVDIYSLHPPQLLRTIHTPIFHQMTTCEAVDLDHDGHKELVIGYAGDQNGPPTILVYSPATGALLRTIVARPGSGQFTFSVVRDIDGDGCDDLAVLGAGDPITNGSLTFLSGQTGQRLGAWAFTPPIYIGTSIATVGDVDGDGFDDIVVGNPDVGGSSVGGTGTGGWQMLSGRLLGTMLVQPVNCYSGPFPPQLGVTRPILGSTMAIAGRDAPPAAPGALAVSFMPVSFTNLGAFGCNAWLDLPTTVILGWLPPAQSWQLGAPIPNVRTLIGAELALQAFYIGTTGPLGYDLTNGIWARVGY